MIRDTQRLSRKVYDLLIIGGGINGAALANMAAGEGLSVALIEKGDFASGTSSKSTKLMHGGIRYLENLEFDLVHEALKERFIQLKNLPHLVKPIPFIIPVYKGDPRPLWMIKLGVFLYDLLSGQYAIDHRRVLTAKEITTLENNIKQEGLLGGVLYYDAQMDDARVCLENILSADQKGAHVANYVEALSFIKEKERVTGVEARDLRDQHRFKVKAKRIVCAAGPWANEILKKDNLNTKKIIRTTKGIHIVYKEPLTKHALVFTAQDKRIFFVIPFRGHTLIGTTDTNYIRRPDDVTVNPKDVDYLLTEVKKFLPNVSFKEENIVTTFVGLRPLVRKGGSPSKVSRKHVIYETKSGLIFILGGKYTTYRKIAGDCLKKITKAKLTDDYPLYGSGTIQESPEAAAKKYGLAIEVIQALRQRYGTKYCDVLKLTETDQTLKERVCTCCLVIKAELAYAVKVEMACTQEDIIERRLSLGFDDCPTGQCRQAIAQFIP